MAERNYVAARAEESVTERSAQEIRHDIAERREQITEAVDKLSDRVQETLDWRSYVAEHPLATLGVAAGIGFLVSGIFKPRPTPRERILDAMAEGVEDITGRIRSSLDMLPVKALGATLSPKRTIKAAITALATKAAADYAKRELSSMLSSYRDSSTEAVEEGNNETANSKFAAAEQPQPQI